MSLGSRLGIESKGMAATLVFYAVVGVVFLALLPLTGFPPHVGIISVFSLATAYGTFRKRSWAIWPVIILFFVATTFSVYTLYFYLLSDYVLSIGMILYLIATWVFTGYVASKRRSLES
jgi:hypothetical protein